MPINNETGWLPVNDKTVLGILRKGVPHPDMKIMPIIAITKPGWRIGSRSSRRCCILQVSRPSSLKCLTYEAISKLAALQGNAMFLVPTIPKR